jgi:hypothetical protein
MGLLEEYNRKYILTKQRILEEIDEWLLYVFYLENDNLQLRTTYKSPIRPKDDSPSFSIFENTRSKKEVEYLWKDSALNKSGTIWELLELMFNLDSQQVLQMISNDFAILDDSKEVKVTKIVSRPVSKPEIRIRIKSKSFTKEAYEFWNQYYVTERELIFNRVQLVDYVWFNDEQQFPYKVKELMFGYPEWNHETSRWHWQLYCPYSKEFKFRNDLLENQIFSWNNLIFDESSNLVITKSKKDVICLNSFGVQAVSSRSESTKIKDKTVRLLQESYKNTLLLYDNDLAGLKAVEHYPTLESVIIPIDSGEKDFSDFLKKYGRRESKQLLRELNIL